MSLAKQTIPLSIILPCYNPLPNWVDTILDALDEIKTRLPRVEIELIIVNDGSIKNVNEADVERLKNKIEAFHFIHRAVNKGKGYTLRQGVEIATKDICIYTDIDFPYTTDSFVDVFNTITEQSLDVIVGVRNSGYYENVPLLRRWISKSLRFFIRLFLRMKISDTQCGIKGFSKKGRATFLQTEINRYLFDMEFVFLASHAPNIAIEPIEVTLKPNIVFSRVNLKILFSESLSFIKLIFKSIFK